MNRIKELRTELGMSQGDLAAELGVSRQAVSNYERGLRDPDFEALDTMSQLFNASFEYILGRSEYRIKPEDDGDLIASLPGPVLDYNNGDVKKTLAFVRAQDEDAAREGCGPATDFEKIGAVPYRPTRVIPILGTISAGLPLYADEHIEGYMTTDIVGNGEYFALRVKGDSMNAAQICDGNVIIVRKQDVVENNDIAVILVNGDEATVKRWYKDGNTVQLIPQSFNPENQIQIYDTRKVKIKILGKVVKNVVEFE